MIELVLGMGATRHISFRPAADLFDWATLRNSEPDAFIERSDRIARDFAEWKQQPGACHVLRDMHALASVYYRDFRRYGLRVSMKYLYEIERYRVRSVRARLRRIGADLDKWNGYRLNNNFTALIARHIISRHPEWEGMFEFRERKAA